LAAIYRHSVSPRSWCGLTLSYPQQGQPVTTERNHKMLTPIGPGGFEPPLTDPKSPCMESCLWSSRVKSTGYRCFCRMPIRQIRRFHRPNWSKPGATGYWSRELGGLLLSASAPQAAHERRQVLYHHDACRRTPAHHDESASVGGEVVVSVRSGRDDIADRKQGPARPHRELRLRPQTGSLPPTSETWSWSPSPLNGRT
jgi:hypothetical protein